MLLHEHHVKIPVKGYLLLQKPPLTLLMLLGGEGFDVGHTCTPCLCIHKCFYSLCVRLAMRCIINVIVMSLSGGRTFVQERWLWSSKLFDNILIIKKWPLYFCQETTCYTLVSSRHSYLVQHQFHVWSPLEISLTTLRVILGVCLNKVIIVVMLQCCIHITKHHTEVTAYSQATFSVCADRLIIYSNG